MEQSYPSLTEAAQPAPCQHEHEPVQPKSLTAHGSPRDPRCCRDKHVSVGATKGLQWQLHRVTMPAEAPAMAVSALFRIITEARQYPFLATRWSGASC